MRGAFRLLCKVSGKLESSCLRSICSSSIRALYWICAMFEIAIRDVARLHCDRFEPLSVAIFSFKSFISVPSPRSQQLRTAAAGHGDGLCIDIDIDIRFELLRLSTTRWRENLTYI